MGTHSLINNNNNDDTTTMMKRIWGIPHVEEELKVRALKRECLWIAMALVGDGFDI